MKTKHAVCLMLALLSSGCAQLSVKVDIFDRERLVDSPPAIRSAAEKLEAVEFRNRTLGIYDQQLTNYVKAVEDCGQALVDRGYLSGAMQNDWVSDHAKYIERELDVVRGTNDAAISIMRDARLTRKLANRNEKFLQAWETFEKANVLRKVLPSEFVSMMATAVFNLVAVQTDADGYWLTDDPAAWGELVKDLNKGPIRAFSNSVQQTANSYVGSGDVFNEPLASTVVCAPEECWRGVYNHTYANGLFGDSDIAVKMVSLGNFTLKGVRLDASKMIAATFDSLQQAIKIAAAAYGIPSFGGAGNNSGNSTPAVSAASSAGSPQDQIPKVQVQVLTIQQAEISVIDSILLERGVLASNASTVADYTSAIKQIQASFKANRSLLSP